MSLLRKIWEPKTVLPIHVLHVAEEVQFLPSQPGNGPGSQPVGAMPRPIGKLKNLSVPIGGTPDDSTSTIKFTATFDCPAGHYTIRWRIKVHQNSAIPDGLHLIANVTYVKSDEPDASGSVDVVMTREALEKLEKEQWCDLILEEALVIQPYDGGANVVIELCDIKNQESPEPKRYRFDVKDVNITLINMSAQDGHSLSPPKTSGTSSTSATESFVTIPRPMKSEHNIDMKDVISFCRASDRSLEANPSPLITRIASSRGSHFLATLALSPNEAYITVWDMRELVSASSEQIKPKFAATWFSQDGIGNLAIGLSISASGDQVAIYQEPKIGQWLNGFKLPNAEFGFKLYDNPMVGSTGDPQDQYKMKVAKQPYPAYFNSFVGYGEFLPAPLNAGDNDGKEASSSASSKNAAPTGSIFVACNGLYLDVFEIKSDGEWDRKHSISLSELTPTFSRRITCKIMMESICSNAFMWLQDDGASCTIWDLHTGSNITHISSAENTRFKDSKFRGSSKIAISPDESTVALASPDGNLTTYFARTGIAIHNRKFPGYKIEHVGFNGHDDRVLLTLRNSATFILETRILDTLRLNSEIATGKAPIPIIGTSVLASFPQKDFLERGIVFEAAQSKINCYIFHQPTPPPEFIRDPSTDSVAKVWKTSKSSTCPRSYPRYELKVSVHGEVDQEGDGAKYWVRCVEVHMVTDKQSPQRVLFSFVPEPWVHYSISNQKSLIAYFVGNEGRFVVIGLQTVQIWRVPTSKKPKCMLLYIWSKPRVEPKSPSGVGCNWWNVRDYYLEIEDAKIYSGNGDISAEIKVIESSSGSREVHTHTAFISKDIKQGTRHAFQDCYWSIHLLAASYVFSTRGCKKKTRDLNKVKLTYEDHTEAVVSFTQALINRVMPRTHVQTTSNDGAPSLQPTSQTEPISPFGAVPLGDNPNQHFQNTSDNPEVIEAIQLKVATLLTILLSDTPFQETNQIFVEGLLSAPDCNWIPRADKSLNPIDLVINTNNERLLSVFIDYCIKSAKMHHPAYMTPAIQCLKMISDLYPNILSDMFRKASYVPVLNHHYVVSHAQVVNRTKEDWFNFAVYYMSFKNKTREARNKSQDIGDYRRPVFCLLSQLHFCSPSWLATKLHIPWWLEDNLRRNIFPDLIEKEKKNEKKKKKKPVMKHSHKIYVCPFPKFSTYGRSNSWGEDDCKKQDSSAFAMLAGKDFFDSPAMFATLTFKWKKFGFFIWLARFIISLIFFACVITLTAEQISASTPSNPTGDLTPEDISRRYLMSWRPFFRFTIAAGLFVILYDIVRFVKNWKKYRFSPYWLLRMLANCLTITGCIMFLRTKPGTLDDSSGTDRGPSQIWYMSFAILALYLNTLFELRPIKQIGIVVNIILNIAQRIIWFFLIFVIFIIAFTQALLHMLHTRKDPPCVNGCEDGVFQDKYPTDFFSALSATYFFLAGVYDPISEPIKSAGAAFHILMTIFFTFTSILFLNLLIAVMNDAFNESKEQGELAWLNQWSGVIADVEFIFLSRERHNGNYSPDYIYYGANEKDANDYESKYCIDNKSNLSIENRFVVETISDEQHASQVTQRTILQDVNGIYDELDKVKKTLNRNEWRERTRNRCRRRNKPSSLAPIASSVQVQPPAASPP